MKNKITAAIHQPNFLPWLGYFDKIIRSDVFIFLDHTLTRPKNAIWTKRVQILCNQTPCWLTIPLKQSVGLAPISELQLLGEGQYRAKHLKTIHQNYGKAPYYDEVQQLLNFFYDYESDCIAAKNISFITNVCARLGIERTFVKSSDLACQHASTELLAEICRQVKANAYLYGKGASNYQDNEILERQGIEPIAQNFIHPTYRQFNSPSFVQGLSIVDTLMNCGIEGTKKLLAGGVSA